MTSIIKEFGWHVKTLPGHLKAQKDYNTTNISKKQFDVLNNSFRMTLKHVENSRYLKGNENLLINKNGGGPTFK